MRDFLTVNLSGLRNAEGYAQVVAPHSRGSIPMKIIEQNPEEIRVWLLVRSRRIFFIVPLIR